jgi:nucleotide-binding universal stress UspA family protein
MSDGPSHLVVGYDRRETSRYALSMATDLTRKVGGHLHVVHVVDLLDYPVDPDSSEWEEQAQVALGHERRRVDALMEGSGVEWTYHPERGQPVGALIAVADRFDALMIVVGTRGAGMGASMQRFLGGGSVSHGLIQEPGRPVLIVSRPPGGHGHTTGS